MTNNIFKFNKIKLILISLIIIFGIIFIIIGERPRHKEPIPQQIVKQPITDKEPYSQAQPLPKSKQTSAIKNTVKTIKKETTDNKSSLNIDAKKIISEKYKDNGNKEIYEKALEKHKIDVAQDSSSLKDGTDTQETEAGLATTAGKMNLSSEKTAIDSQQPLPPVSGKDFFDLKNPVSQEKKADKELNKIATLEEKNPARYATESTADQKMIYMIDTYTADLKVLYKETDVWKDLGKPDDAKEYNSNTYALEGVTSDSAVIFNSSTAHTWKVSVNGSNINWKSVNPFPKNDSK